MFSTVKPRFYVAVIAATALLGSFSVQAAEITISPETVKEIQKKLNQEGYNAGPVDGQFGQSMAVALKNFQKDNELEETGKLNFRTLSKMNIDVLAMGSAQAAPRPETNDQSAEEIDAAAPEPTGGENAEAEPAETDAADTEPAAGDEKEPSSSGQTTTDMIDKIQKKDSDSE